MNTVELLQTVYVMKKKCNAKWDPTIPLSFTLHFNDVIKVKLKYWCHMGERFEGKFSVYTDGDPHSRVRNLVQAESLHFSFSFLEEGYEGF